MNPAAPLYYLAVSIAAQVCGFGSALLLSRQLEIFHHPFVFVLTGGAVAFLISRALKVSLPWQLLNLALPSAVFCYESASLPGWLLPTAAVLALVIYLPTFWTHVPFYPTSPQMYQEVLRRLPNDRPFRFIDLGSGYGSMLLFLARERPQGSFVGAEIAPLPFIVSKLRSIGRPNVAFTAQSFWQIDFSAFDILYAFLSPTPMEKLWEKVRKEVRPGTYFMTNTFKVPAPCQEQVQVSDERNCTLFVHRL